MSRGNQIALKQFAINHFKREYKRKEYDEEKLKDVKSSLESYGPRETYHKKKEYELRIQAIDELLDNE